MQKERGQISIFFSTTVIVMITFLAFIINIGIFVKAKINLQNATDAAAYAGASVQARQLTNIGYVNWSMRNVFKEWMFKYYVMGGLNLESVSDQVLPTPPGSQPCAPKTGGGLMDFTMACYKRTTAGGEDQYNFPSTCMDFANTGGVGLCTRFLVPGLPRFSQQNVLGMDETTNAFIDSIVSEKSRDCSDRTELNFLTNNTWAYNVTETVDQLDNISADAPEIAINFMGAFPQAFELGMRIRNLESEVNFPPQNGVCGDVGSGVGCNVTANELTQSHQERPLKAYLSGWRNLGSSNDSEMKDSFTLTEIPPKLDTSILNSLSTLLIPPGDPNANNKYYVDLKLITVNYATFYTAFATSQGDINVGGQTISAEGQCASTKMGLPVPGYPMHFVKNPDFLTYYAVEGKANFVGLFNPFAGGAIVLKAYAAAKPFGGRIGPMIFDVSDRNIIKARSSRKSSPWISALNTATFLDLQGNPNPGRYSPGKPIPINAGTGADQFWMTSDTDNIGGFIADGNEIFFGVPNMIYDYPNTDISNNESYYASDNLQIIGYKGSSPDARAGLYNRDMFNKFKSKLRGIGGVVTTESINDALTVVRAPTLWDAHNFLIPTPEDVNKALATDSFGAIDGTPDRTISIPGDENYTIWRAALYAPLYNPNNPFSIFKTQQDLKIVLSDYIQRQEPAILKYKSSMNMVAADIFVNNRSGATDTNTGAAAARVISDLTAGEFNAINSSINITKEAVPSCASIAGRFLYFYSGNAGLVRDTAGCPTPLPDLLENRWANANLVGNYIFEYALPSSNDFRKKLFSAYQPGVFKAARNGTQNNPVSGATRNRFRNSYSTKFIPVNAVSESDNAMFKSNDLMLIYSEGAPKTAPNEIKRTSFRNPLTPAAVGIDLSRIQH